MEDAHVLSLLVIGLLLLAGYAAHALGPRTHVPRVTLLIVLGLLAGPSFLDVVPEAVTLWFPHIAHMALAIIGFLLGESFMGRDLKRMGKAVLWVSLGETLTAAGFVLLGLLVMGQPLLLALLLAGIAPASAPAATFDVVKEGRARGPLTSMVLGVVAIDDAWGILLFSVFLSAAEAVGGSGSYGAEILRGLWEVFGAVLVGVVLGIPMAAVTGRLRKGEPHLLEALGFVFVCGGVSLLLNVSYLLSCMVLGAVVANRASHHERPFHAIEGIREPFVAIFFLLSGFRFEFAALAGIGLVGIVYVVLRSVGLILGGRAGAVIGKAPDVVRARVGWCLLPQAGVALGLALMVDERMPDFGATVVPLIIASTVLFEVFGPLVTRWHLRRAGELKGSTLGSTGKSGASGTSRRSRSDL